MNARTTWVSISIAVVLCAASQTALGDVTPEQIDENVEKLAQYLFSQQQPDGSFSKPVAPQLNDRRVYVSPGIKESAALLGLTFAGYTGKDKRMARGFDTMRHISPDTTSVLATRVLVTLRLLKTLDRSRQRSAQVCLETDLKQLLAAQRSDGAWGYSPRSSSSAYPASTITVLRALCEARHAGAKVKDATFSRAMQFILQRQQSDGGWSSGLRMLGGAQPSFGSITASGVASLLESRRVLDPRAGCPCKRSESRGGSGEFERSAERGIAWLAKRFKPGLNPGLQDEVLWRRHWIYNCGRAMSACGYKYLGTHDWYDEAVKELLGRGIPGRNDNSSLMITETTWRIGLLTMCREPVMMNKLKFYGRWNRHPHDAAALTEYVARARKQPLRRQVLELSAKLSDFHDAPILYISTEAVLVLSDAEKKKLRQYTDTGGTILWEASCGNMKAARSLEQLFKEIWPEWQLKALDKGHPLWVAEVKLVGRLPQLRGLNDGVRTFLFYAPRDLSCFWVDESVKKNRLPLQTGQNLLVYATDREPLPQRFEKREIGVGKKYADQKTNKGSRSAIALARIKHGKTWNAGSNYKPWAILASDLEKRIGLSISVAEAVTPGTTVPQGIEFLYLTGRTDCDLGEGGTKWLKDYLAGGGFLFTEGTCGDPAFDESLKKLLADADLTLKPMAADSPLVSGKLFEATGYNVSKVSYTRSLRATRAGRNDPVLYGIYGGKKLVGLYSPYDIMFSQTGYRAFASRGYLASDARALATNIALLMSIK